MKNIFNAADCSEIIARINSLTSTTPAKWGKMDVGQMLAHCNVTYEMIYDNIHPKPNVFLRLILKLFVKNKVVTDAAYSKNSPTAPQFIIKESKNFEPEKKRLIDYINKTQQLGEAYFDGKESLSFGVLNKTEWNHMLYKNLDHHLSQFGA